MTFTFQVTSLCARQHRARRAMPRCSVLAGTNALSGTPITALAGASNYRF
jgi:hypothetical protein